MSEINDVPLDPMQYGLLSVALKNLARERAFTELSFRLTKTDTTRLSTLSVTWHFIQELGLRLKVSLNT